MGNLIVTRWPNSGVVARISSVNQNGEEWGDQITVIANKIVGRVFVTDKGRINILKTPMADDTVKFTYILQEAYLTDEKIKEILGVQI